MADMRKTFELAFAIGGALSPSFKKSHSEAAAEIAKLSKKSQEAMKFNKLQKEFDKNFKEFSNNANKMGTAWKGVVDSIVGPIKQIAIVGAVAGAAIYGLAAKTGQMGDTAVKNASKMGVTTEEYSKMAYAANQSGLSTEQFAGNMKRLNNIIVESVKNGKSEVYVNNKKIMSIRDENKQLKSRSQLLLDTSDAYNKLTTENEKLALANIMFGKAGADMIPFLESGSAGIQKLMGDAERLGIVFDDVSGANAVAFMSSMGELKAAAQGVAIAIGTQLHEPLTKVNEAIVGWITANRELIAQKVDGFIKDTIKWLKENKDMIIGIKDSAVEFVKQIGVWIEKNGGLVEVLKKVVKGFVMFKSLGVVIAIMKAVTATAIFVTSLVTLVVQTKALLGVFGGFKVIASLIGAVSLPMIAVIGAVASLGFAAYTLIKNWEGVVYFFKNLGQTVPIFINDLVEDIKGLFGRLPDWLQNIMSPIKNIILAPIQAIQALLAGDIKGFLANMGKYIINKMALIPILIIKTGNEIIKALFKVDLIASIKEWISPVVQAVGDVLNIAIGAIKDFCVNEFNRVKNVFGNGFFKGIFEVLKSIPTLFIRMGNDVIKAITGIDLIGIAKGWIGSFIATVQNEITRVKDAFGVGIINGIDAVLGFVPRIIVKTIQKVITAITGIDIVETGKTWIQKFIDGVLQTLKNAASFVKNAVQKLLPESVLKVAGGAAKAVSGAVSTVGGVAKSAMPMFGDGGIATEPSIVAEDGKPEAIIPLTKKTRAVEIIRQIAPSLPMLQFAQANKPLPPKKPTSPTPPTPPTSPTSEEVSGTLMNLLQKFAKELNPDFSPKFNIPDISDTLKMPKLNIPEFKMPELKMPEIPNDRNKNNGGGTFNFSPNINITANGGDVSTVKTAVEDALDKAKSQFEKWFSQLQYSNTRVATR